MQAPQQKNTVAATPTAKLEEQDRPQLAREGDAIDLKVEALEERVAPRLAGNHNETFLAD